MVVAAEKMNTVEVVSVEDMAGVVPVVFALTRQTGGFAKVWAYVMVQEVMPAVVTMPTVSLPETVGFDPQDEREGVFPPMTTCPPAASA